MASKIIGGLPATDKQLKALSRKRYKVNETLTRDEADACFNDISKRNGELPEYRKRQLERVKSILNK